jgi:hypothetical protein
LDGPGIAELGYPLLADTDAAERILQGGYIIHEDLDPYAALLIRELRMPDSIRNNPFLCLTLLLEFPAMLTT